MRDAGLMLRRLRLRLARLALEKRGCLLNMNIIVVGNIGKATKQKGTQLSMRKPPTPGKIEKGNRSWGKPCLVRKPLCVAVPCNGTRATTAIVAPFPLVSPVSRVSSSPLSPLATC